MTATPENPFADAIVRLAPLLRDYDRERLFEVMYRLNMRDLRNRMYALGTDACDPDDPRGGLTEDSRAAVEDLTRQQIESL